MVQEQGVEERLSSGFQVIAEGEDEAAQVDAALGFVERYAWRDWIDQHGLMRSFRSCLKA